jgi:hypothetical protein
LCRDNIIAQRSPRDEQWQTTLVNANVRDGTPNPANTELASAYHKPFYNGLAQALPDFQPHGTLRFLLLTPRCSDGLAKFVVINEKSSLVFMKQMMPNQ